MGKGTREQFPGAVLSLGFIFFLQLRSFDQFRNIYYSLTTKALKISILSTGFSCAFLKTENTPSRSVSVYRS